MDNTEDQMLSYETQPLQSMYGGLKHRFNRVKGDSIEMTISDFANISNKCASLMAQVYSSKKTNKILKRFAITKSTRGRKNAENRDNRSFIFQRNSYNYTRAQAFNIQILDCLKKDKYDHITIKKYHYYN